MTDREMLVALLEKLGLKPADEMTSWDAETYVIESDRIRVNRGGGYDGHYAEFRFDADDNLVGHGIFSLP